MAGTVKLRIWLLARERQTRRRRNAVRQQVAYVPAPVVRLRCLICQHAEGVEMEDSRTAYHWEGDGDDPNAAIPLCRACAEQHHEYWNDMWSEYRHSVLPY